MPFRSSAYRGAASIDAYTGAASIDMSDRSTMLALKVIPGSSRDCIAGWLGESLKVRVRAPAERGKANAAVERLVAHASGVPVSSVQIVAGMSSAQKRLEISGLSLGEIHRRLAKSAE